MPQKPKLTWADVLALGPTKIARTLGCPVTTASAWINQTDRSGQPEWQRQWFLRAFVVEERRPTARKKKP